MVQYKWCHRSPFFKHIQVRMVLRATKSSWVDLAQPSSSRSQNILYMSWISQEESYCKPNRIQVRLVLVYQKRRNKLVFAFP